MRSSRRKRQFFHRIIRLYQPTDDVCSMVYWKMPKPVKQMFVLFPGRSIVPRPTLPPITSTARTTLTDICPRGLFNSQTPILRTH